MLRIYDCTRGTGRALSAGCTSSAGRTRRTLSPGCTRGAGRANETGGALRTGGSGRASSAVNICTTRKIPAIMRISHILKTIKQPL